MMNQYFFSADDFGYSPEINKAILLCLKNNDISTASLMANMEFTQEAIEIVKREGLENRIGLHFNLTEGKPLSDEIKKESKFCDIEGNFKATRKKRFFFLSESEKRAVRAELTAQLKILNEAGIKPVYIDSHNHIHEEFGIFRIVLSFSRKMNIPKIRKAKNIGTQTFTKKLYRQLINFQINAFDLARSSHFGSYIDYIAFMKTDRIKPQKTTEIMIHPFMNENNVLYDFFHNEPLMPIFNLISNLK